MTSTIKTNWENIFGVLGEQAIRQFADGLISGRTLYKYAVGTEAAGDVRSLVRGGVSRAMNLARKAVSRRS